MVAFLDLIDDYNDKERFKSLYIKYKGLMAYIINTKVQTNEDVEDVLQDVFFYIAKNFDKIGDIDSTQTKSFICVVTEGFAISKFRKEKKHLNNIPFEEAYETNASYNDFDIYKATDLKILLNSLNDEFRNILYLTYTFGFTSKEIAKIYGITDANVRKKIQFAKAKIRSELQEDQSNE